MNATVKKRFHAQEPTPAGIIEVEQTTVHL
jgi:hypothetical protein